MIFGTRPVPAVKKTRKRGLLKKILKSLKKGERVFVKDLINEGWAKASIYNGLCYARSIGHNVVNRKGEVFLIKEKSSGTSTKDNVFLCPTANVKNLYITEKVIRIELFTTNTLGR